MTLKPLGTNIVATELEATKQTASGIYLPGGAQEKSKVLNVTAIGPDVKEVKVGDQIIIKSYTQTDIKIESTGYIVVAEEDVIATVNK